MNRSLGARLRGVLSRAAADVVLVSPFIKSHVLEEVLRWVPTEIPIVCVTRWRAEEVAAGVSDLEVLELSQERRGCSLFLRNDLHAKYYRADRRCLVGSANLTGRGLGLGGSANCEILIEVDVAHPQLVTFEAHLLANAMPASAEIRAAVARAASALKSGAAGHPAREPAEIDAAGGAGADIDVGWLPACLAPEQLYSIYCGDRSRVSRAAYKDALSDLEILDVPGGLAADGFREVIASRLVQDPLMGRIHARLTHQRITRDLVREALDAEGVDAAADDVQAVRAWISVFFPNLLTREISSR